jgi:hypothetical protein
LDDHRGYLKDIFKEALQSVADVSARSEVRAAARWLAERFDDWKLAGLGIMSLSTVQEFQSKVSLLKVHALIDVPPYSEVLLQGSHDAAFRHPEYMIARDLEFLYGLFVDAESILAGVNWNRPPEWAPFASENRIALGRAVVQACFNLLESYVSGLARAYVMVNEGLDPSVKEKLLDTRASLRERIRQVVKITSDGKVAVDSACDPYAGLFNRVKTRRDSFVHCAPGSEANKFGVVKEAVFHDINKEGVDEAMTLTCQLIRETWRSLNHRDGPTWLQDLPAITEEHQGLHLMRPIAPR